MTAPDSVPLYALAEDNLAAASPDLLRATVKTFANTLMSAEADALCNAEYGQVSDERVNHRNGYRSREWDTRARTVELAIPKLRSGNSFPHWLTRPITSVAMPLLQPGLLLPGFHPVVSFGAFTEARTVWESSTTAVGSSCRPRTSRVRRRSSS